MMYLDTSCHSHITVMMDFALAQDWNSVSKVLLIRSSNGTEVVSDKNYQYKYNSRRIQFLYSRNNILLHRLTMVQFFFKFVIT
jgi:hypothetical protein